MFIIIRVSQPSPVTPSRVTALPREGECFFIVVTTTATFKNNIIGGNTADENGGGIYTDAGCNKIVFTNNVIINNTTDGNGGGVNSYCNQVSLTNNIISGNTAAQGGGLWLNIPASITNLYNNIIWNNTATSGSDLCVLNGTSVPSTINMHNNNFDHSAAGFVSTLPYYIKPSNLDNVDPLFVDANNGNYQLQAGSSMIDAGENEAPEIPSTDKDDKPRLMNGVVDIGAYEYQWQSGDSSQVEFSSANYSVNENDGSITINVARTGGRKVPCRSDMSWQTGAPKAVPITPPRQAH